MGRGSTWRDVWAAFQLGVLRINNLIPSAFLFLFLLNSPPAVSGGCHLGCLGSEWFFFAHSFVAAICLEVVAFLPQHEARFGPVVSLGEAGPFLGTKRGTRNVSAFGIQL